MDRREALTKLAVGGGTIVGASAIRSAPVFASATPGEIVATSTTPDSSNGHFFVTLGAITCPQSATGAPSIVSEPMLQGDGGTDSNWTGNPLTGMGSLGMENGQQYEYTVTVSARCNYGAGPGQTLSCTTTFTSTYTADTNTYSVPIPMTMCS